MSGGKHLKRPLPPRPPKKQTKGIGWICPALAVCFTLLLGVSIQRYVSYAMENREGEAFIEELQNKAIVKNPTAQFPDGPISSQPETTPEAAPIALDFDFLQSENPDIIGWIYCENTAVNYPILQAEDNQYYLRRRTDKAYSIAGSIFADYRNSDSFSDENTVIYGHNMADGSMFALLPYYAGQEFYEEHPVWYILTPTMDYKVELFAGFVTSTDSPVYSTRHETTASGQPIMEKAWQGSDFQSPSAPMPGERTVTFSTCSYEFTDARYVAIGTLQELKNRVHLEQ